MNNSVGSAIEKIKLQELDNDSKLKEKREYEAVVSNLSRTIKDTVQYTEISQKENDDLKKKIDDLRSELIIKKTKRDALLAQVQACNEELEVLRKQSEQGISKVWEVRSGLCLAVQSIADECDVRSLLIKPMCPEFIQTPVIKCTNKNCTETIIYEDRLKLAIVRRTNAIKERDRLQAEPDVGEEFVRIRNALQYSLEMVSKLNK